MATASYINMFNTAGGSSDQLNSGSYIVQRKFSDFCINGPQWWPRLWKMQEIFLRTFLKTGFEKDGRHYQIFFSRDDQSWNNQLSFKNYLSNTQISSCSTLFRFMQAFKLHLPPNCDRNTTFWLLIKHIQKVYVLVLISTRFVATCLSEGTIPPNHQCEPVARVRSNWEPDARVSFHCWPDVTCMGQIQLWTSCKGQFHLWTRCKSQFPLWTRCNLNRSDPTVNQLQGPVPIVNQMQGSDPKWEESNHFVSKWAWFKQAVKCQSFSVISLL